MSAALVNRMPFRPRRGTIENISYILDNRWNGPHLIAHDGEDDSRDNFRLPRQFPFDDDGLRKESTSAKMPPKAKSLDGIVRNEVAVVLGNLLKTLLPYGTTLDSVLVDSARSELKAAQEPTTASKQPVPSKSPEVFFSYFNSSSYSLTGLSFGTARYVTSSYTSFAQPSKSLFDGYIAPRYITLPFKTRSRLRKRKRWKWSVAPSYLASSTKDSVSEAYTGITHIYGKIGQYLKEKQANTNSKEYSNYAKQTIAVIGKEQTPYIPSQKKEYVKEHAAITSPLQASLQSVPQQPTTSNTSYPIFSAANQSVYRNSHIENKHQRNKLHNSQALSASYQSISSSKRITLDNLIAVPSKLSTGYSFLENSVQSTTIPANDGIYLAAPSSPSRLPHRPYVTKDGQVVKDAYSINLQITEEVQNRATGKDYLSIVFSELTRSGYRVGIVEQTYTDTTTGQQAIGKKLVLLDNPDLHIEVLVGETPQSTKYFSFIRGADTPLLQHSKNGSYITILFKKDNVYINELEQRLETPTNGKVNETYHASLIKPVYKKAA